MISKLENSEYDYLIISTTYISPLSVLDNIQNELQNITAKLIFDLTLINGTNSNRYISAIIQDGIINRRTFAIAQKINLKVKQNSINFFMNNQKLVANGTIPKALKALLIAGEII